MIKDYDLGIHYHPDKATIVADALSRKLHYMSASIEENQPMLHEQFQKLNPEVVEEGYVAALAQHPTLESQIQATQLKDPAIAEIKLNL